MVGAIETRSAPTLLGATRRAFTFYLGNPISSIETRSAPGSLAAARRGFTFYLADPSARLKLTTIALGGSGEPPLPFCCNGRRVA